MLRETKLKTLKDLVGSSTHEELIWINGYLAGLVAQNKNTDIVSAKTPVLTGKVSIVFGTETGNSKRVAVDLTSRAKKRGLKVKVTGLDQYRLQDLEKEENLLVIISTQGDGEPPVAAQKFYDFIHNESLQLNKLKYSVLALGDSAYPLFCKAGEDVDKQLQKLGAHRLAPLRRCDTDFDSDANEWFEEVLLQSANASSDAQKSSGSELAKRKSKVIAKGRIISHLNLNDNNSNKETYHIEIESDDIAYEPGDSIGIVPQNSEHLVESITSLLSIDINKAIGYKGSEITINDLLRKKVSLVYLPERVVKKYAQLVDQDIPDTRIDLLDLLRIYPLKENEQFLDLIEILEPITPRLYSISSSPEMHTGEVHITVAKNTFQVNGEIKYGLCSEFLSNKKASDEVEYYVSRNSHFKLPAPEKDIIMIGPGTGIAPFRSFIAERDAIGAPGRNWLFFGEQHFETDFLYQTEIQNWFETGVLTHVSVAFSRDQDQKIYVQHRMKEFGARFYEWMEQGAYVYICGQKAPMSVDVENAIIDIVKEFGNKSSEEAQGYITRLKEEDRLLLDVY